MLKKIKYKIENVSRELETVTKNQVEFFQLKNNQKLTTTNGFTSRLQMTQERIMELEDKNKYLERGTESPKVGVTKKRRKKKKKGQSKRI